MLTAANKSSRTEVTSDLSWGRLDEQLETNMIWAATLANFFLPGLGYLIAVPHKRIQGGIFLLGAFGLTYVEQIAVGMDHPAFFPMFISVFVMNTGFAIDAYMEVKALGQD